jgi:diguanylate cyclase (GGDEF)-like protein/PAS domain S-box-containing protein
MIDNLNVGIADHELIFVDGKAVDYRFNYVNRAYEQLTGLTSETVTSHLASEVFAYTDLDLIEKYERIVKSDLREDFEFFYERRKHWYQVTAYKSGQNRFLTAFSNITEMKQVAEEQIYMIYHDTLTGLLNEYGLTQALKNIQNVSRAICYFIDVRDFGSIVDFYGLDVSDAVIVEIAQYLKHYPHKDKLVSRYGGDLFVLLVLNPNNDEDLRLNTYVKEIVFKDYAYQDILLQVRNQVGFAHYPEDVPHFDQLVSAASMASKKAAKSDRNIMIKYHEDLRTTKAKELELAKSIKHAIDSDHMHVYFQKIMDTQNQKIHILEALARWMDPVLGYIPPDYFFRVAQEFNLIDYLEDYILEKAVRAFSKLIKQNELSDASLSLNVTPQVFLSHEQPEFIHELCERYFVPCERVIIEISENVFIHPMESKMSFVN